MIRPWLFTVFLGAASLTEPFPDPSNFRSIGWVLVVIGALVVILNQIMEFVSRFRGDKDPPTRREWNEMNERRDKANEERDAKLDLINDKVDCIPELKTDVDWIKKSLGRLESKL